jgi:hypothetical protein
MSSVLTVTVTITYGVKENNVIIPHTLNIEPAVTVAYSDLLIIENECRRLMKEAASQHGSKVQSEFHFVDTIEGETVIFNGVMILDRTIKEP